MTVVGVDGWRNGWVGVELAGRAFRSAWVAADAHELLEACAAAEVIAIDIPIGLPASGTRACDRAAKQLLGSRRSSLFLAPPRSVMETEPYQTANARCKERFGFGISRQAYGLRTKVLEIDAVHDSRLHEVHPELTFKAMVGEVLPSKKTWVGVEARRRALAAEDIVLPAEPGEAGSVPVDDVLDAAAAAWTAQRIAAGTAGVVSEEVERDERGKRMAIWF